MRFLYMLGLLLCALPLMAGSCEDQPESPGEGFCLDTMWCLDTYCPTVCEPMDDERPFCDPVDSRCDCRCASGTGGTGGAGGTGGSPLVCPVNTDPVEFFDGTFVNENWSDELVDGRSNGDNNEFDAAQLTSGGNPGAYRGMTLTIGEGQVALWQLNLKDTATWNPATDGAICGLLAQMDGTDRNAGTAETIYSMAFKQDNTVYWSDRFRVNVDGWLTMTPPVDEGDFTQFDHLDMPRDPDFSDTGLPIAFGFLAGAAGNNDTGAPRVFNYGVDNWRFAVCLCASP